jgi:hypothetical protein
MSFELSIAVFGPGTDSNYRSHWGFIVSNIGDKWGDLLHTQLIDKTRLLYQFEARSGHPILSQQSEGRFKIATLTSEQRLEAKELITKEAAPRDGKRRCQGMERLRAPHPRG